MVSIVSGLVCGLIATVVMSVFTMALGDDSPPPTALFWSKYTGNGPPGEYTMQGTVVDAVYGVVAGSVFAVLATALGLEVTTLDGSLLRGLAYGVLLVVGPAAFG